LAETEPRHGFHPTIGHEGAGSDFLMALSVTLNLRCAEPVALGAALSAGEKEILAVVAVANRGNGFIVLSPCGNCRQTLLDYAPEADIIFTNADGVTQSKAKNLLPGAYIAPDFGGI